jgi:predicted GH43/DUF377 family glycosyl hydrolase
MPKVVFPTGTLLRGDEIWMYYGAAHTCICLAKCTQGESLNKLGAQ